MEALIPIVEAVTTVAILLRIMFPGVGQLREREVRNPDLQRPGG